MARKTKNTKKVAPKASCSAAGKSKAAAKPVVKKTKK